MKVSNSVEPNKEVAKAEKKSKNEKKRVLAVVIKPNRDVIGNDIKIQRSRVLCKFVARMAGGTFLEGDDAFLIEIPHIEGEDPSWVSANVLKFVDIDKATNDLQADMTAEKLEKVLETKDLDGKKRVGVRFLEHELGKMYIKPNVWVV